MKTLPTIALSISVLFSLPLFCMDHMDIIEDAMEVVTDPNQENTNLMQLANAAEHVSQQPDLDYWREVAKAALDNTEPAPPARRVAVEVSTRLLQQAKALAHENLYNMKQDIQSFFILVNNNAPFNRLQEIGDEIRAIYAHLQQRASHPEFLKLKKELNNPALTAQVNKCSACTDFLSRAKAMVARKHGPRNVLIKECRDLIRIFTNEISTYREISDAMKQTLNNLLNNKYQSYTA